MLAMLLCTYTAAWLLVLWVGERIGRRWATFDSGRADALMRARNHIAIHAAHGSLIEMPAHLKTRDEMVAWMTRELPRLTAGEHRHSP
jgi:hypothetical protein